MNWAPEEFQQFSHSATRRAFAGDDALATEVLFKGLGAIGIGLAIFGIFWLYHRLTD